MKKYIPALCVAALLALCCGCTGPEDTPAATAAQEALYFVYRDVPIALDMPAESLLPLLPEPKHYSEATSCAFEGLDKTYDFGSFAIQTYPTETGDRVHSFWFQDDTVSTVEGIYIGMPPEEVTRRCPEAQGDEETRTLEQNGGRLTIVFQNSLVSSIQYTLLL